MSILSRLFGSSNPASKQDAEPELYEGCRIYPEPVPDGGKFRLAARIEKDIDGETRSHSLIRADLLDDKNSASEAACRKARQVIDEQGERLFKT